MRGIYLFLIVVTLPLLAALGHDIYLFSTNGGSMDTLQQSINAENEPGIKSFFATAGYIWTHYAPESYKTVFESTDEETWKTINWLLAQKAVVLGAVFAGFFFMMALVVKILGGAGGEGADAKFGGRKGSFNVGERQKYTNIALVCYILTVVGLVPVSALISIGMLGPSKGTVSRSHFNNQLHILIISVIFGLVYFFALVSVMETREPVLTYSVAGAVVIFALYTLYRWLFGLMALLRGETFKEG